MPGSIRGYLVCAGMTALALGIGNARTYQLKKILVINETGQAESALTNQIKYRSDYYRDYLAPKYGFECTVPANQAAIDSVMRDDSLKTYDVVVFNGGRSIGGAGAVGDTAAQHAFERWMKAGGGAVGVSEFLNHNNSWPWLRDTLLNGAIATHWPSWMESPNMKVQWDTLKTDGFLRSSKSEYDSIRACFPRTRFTYPDSWYSFSPNIRSQADVLMTIDENTYAVPAGGSMGLGHPVMWAYHLPWDSLGNVGRFIYFSRGMAPGSFDGTGSGHAPMTVAEGAIQQGDTVFSDTSHTLMTKGWLWQSLRWAAGLTIPSTAHVHSGQPAGGLAEARGRNGVLKVVVSGASRHEVGVFTISGRILASRTGAGSARYSFPNLKRPGLYIVQVKSARGIEIRRIML